MTYVDKETQVIRIEHADGYGIFRSQNVNGDYRWNVFDDVSTRQLVSRHDNFPTPWSEGRSINTNEFCGFKTLDQIKEWFTSEELRYIMGRDFKIYLLKVSQCFVGNCQVVFEKERIITKEDISNLFL